MSKLNNLATRIGIVADKIDQATTEGDAALQQVQEASDTALALGAQGSAETLGQVKDELDSLLELLRSAAAHAGTIQSQTLSLAQGTGRSASSAGPDAGSAAVPTTVATGIDELRTSGHGPQRHGSQVTRDQLENRALYGIDPMTGTTDDGDRPGTRHVCSRVATKINSDEAYVQGERAIRASRAFDEARTDAEASADPRFRVKLPLEEIYGSEYQKHATGIRRNGSRTMPTGDPPGSRPPTEVDFTGGEMVAVYARSPDGSYRLKTMYPDPR